MADVKIGMSKQATGFINLTSEDINKKLMNRPSPDDLVQKNIIRADEINGVSGAIVQQKKVLEEERKKDSLTRKLSLRPTSTDLKEKNILKPDIIPELPEESKTIADRAVKLKSILKKRPEQQALKDQNILKTDAAGPIASAQQKLRRSILEDTLENKIRDRPAPEVLKEAKILLFAETVEVLPTFMKSEYNRKPDADATFKNLTQQMKIEIREELNQYKKSEMDVHVDSLIGFNVGIDNTCFH